MADDITELLGNLLKLAEASPACESFDPTCHACLACEAISAIERLQAERDELRKALEQIEDMTHPVLHRDAEDLREIARRALAGD